MTAALSSGLNESILEARIDSSTPVAARRVDPNIYGQYFEHLEDCIYPGIQRDGRLRTDVIDASRDLGVPIVRWPGGCFADVYHWEDGVGPRGQRPLRRNWHWGGTDSNAFGTDEFLSWNEATGSDAYINVNLGTAPLDEALRWLDYCNGTEPTPEVLRRHLNGRADPWNVRYWGIGNETWGAWEAGHSTASDYARTLGNWADFFKRYDPDLHIIGVGSSAANNPDWDRTVLEHAGQHIDYLSLHLYGSTTIGNEADEEPAIVCTPVYFEKRIERMASVLAAYNREHRPDRPIRIAMDEWNIRHYRQSPDGEEASLDRSSRRTMADALFAAGVFHAMIRNSDVVGMANYVFLVNGNAVIDARGDEIVRSALFPVFEYYRRHFCGEALDVRYEGPRMAMPEVLTEHPGRAPYAESVPDEIDVLDVVATRDDRGDAVLAIVNRHPTSTVRVSVTAQFGRSAKRVERLEPTQGGASIVPVDWYDEDHVDVPPLSLTFLR